MSIEHISKALKTNYKGNAKLILIVLADCADENGYCYPSYSHIQKHASIGSRNTVSDHLKSLENDGAIKKTQRYNESNFYQILPSEYRNCTSTTFSTLTTKSIKEKTKSERFVIPTENDIKIYCESKGNDVFMAKGFIDFYESKGWKVGKNKMVSWKGALGGWINRQTKTVSSDLKGSYSLNGKDYYIDNYGVQDLSNGNMLNKQEARIIYERLSHSA